MNNEVINGISAISSVVSAYHSLKGDVLDPDALEQAACFFIDSLCVENDSLCHARSLCNDCEFDGVAFGSINISLNAPETILSVLRERIPQFINRDAFKVDAKLSYKNPFSILIRADQKNEDISALCQNILLSTIKANKSLRLHCVDFASGGNFFYSVHKLITSLPSKTGGKIYTKANEFSELIKNLEDSAVKAMTKLGSMYTSVRDHNCNNEVKIDEHLVIIYLGSIQYLSDDYNRLRILIENGKRNGMSFIVVGHENTINAFPIDTDFYLETNNDCIYIGKEARLPINVCLLNNFSNADIENLIVSLQSSEIIDTNYSNHLNLHTEYFTLDSSEALRIPFAIDKNNMPVYFEIGGNAPSHAIIAGSTGSGKSVALHTLIMQIVHNYHPDDVEIWAIDYKAVEFASYFNNHTPHFRVIANDTSNEFSLSLIDLLYQEYEKRQREFLNADVKDINGYRRLNGKHSMPRIIVFIDEFQLLTQAVQDYSGNIDYRIRLENLFRLTRAMGISFVLCSQTIASGLSGLSNAARDQIGCRLCLKHDDDNEIRETLMLSGSLDSDIVTKAKELRRGQCIYKRARWADEHSDDGRSYEFLHTHVLFIDDDLKTEMINKANELLKNDFTPKDEILVRGESRFYISEKIRHPLTKFINGKYEPDCESVEWYPAAPTTLSDFFKLEIDNSSASNLMFVGEDDDLRESTVVHSVCGFLMNPNSEIVVSIVDENNTDRVRMANLLKKIRSSRLKLNIGIVSTLRAIDELRRIHPTPGKNTIYIWCGLDKLKNELFLMAQDETYEDSVKQKSIPMSNEEVVADMMSFLAEITDRSVRKDNDVTKSDNLTFDDCKGILRQAFDVGPENNKHHMIIYNNYKSMKKTGFIDKDCFDNRIGTRMSLDDSYELFNSSLAVNKTDENTVIYYDGSGGIIPLRPYLIPDDNWFKLFNEALRAHESRVR